MTSHGEVPTPLHEIGDVGCLGPVWIKDESVHPSGTFKDRLARRAVRRYTEPTRFGAISYGNTALSFAMAVQHTGHQFVWFMPTDFATWTLGPDTSGTTLTGAELIDVVSSLGARVLSVDLKLEYLDTSKLQSLVGSHLSDNLPFVDVTDGLDVPCYEPILEEALDQLEVTPAVCVVQFGAGVLADEFCAVLARRSQNTRLIPVSTPQPRSLARMLYGPLWVDTDLLAKNGVAPSQRSTTRSGAPEYDVHALSEADIEGGLALMGELGLSAEPSGAAGLGAALRLVAAESTRDAATHGPLLVINTGNAIATIADRLSIRG